jgi:hypothetical protein
MGRSNTDWHNSLPRILASNDLLSGLKKILPSTMQWSCKNMDMPDDRAVIVNDIGTCKAFTLSNGSFNDSYGTDAWVVEKEGSTGKNTAELITWGGGKDRLAYRSELAGIFVILAK